MMQRADDPRDSDPPFACTWEDVGLRGAQVRAQGRLDAASGPQLAHTVRAAAATAPLVLLLFEDVTFVDREGLGALHDVVITAHRAGRRLVVAGLRPEFFEVVRQSVVGDALHVLDATVHVRQDDTPPQSGLPPQNPVNAAIIDARVMAVADRRLWVQTEDGGVHRAWAPPAVGEVDSPGRLVELYVDECNKVNGWRDIVTGLAVNQRRLPAGLAPREGAPMVCQGRCGITWQAPAAALLADHDEHCLTCAGPLAAG